MKNSLASRVPVEIKGVGGGGGRRSSQQLCICRRKGINCSITIDSVSVPGLQPDVFLD